MNYFERFKLRMERSGGSIKGEHLRNSREFLNSLFGDDTSNRDNIYFWEMNDTDYENKTPLNIRFYNRSYSAAKGGSVQFQSLYNQPIIVGDMIYEKDAKQYWLCSESFNINDINWEGKLIQCNWMLKWQNKNGDILEYPCYVINATQYNSGETTTKLTNFTYGTSQYMIQLPCDENTVILDTPQRFFLDYNTVNPTTYVVTQNDTTSLHLGAKGIVKLTIYETPYDSKTDNKEIGVCGYISDNEPYIPTPTGNIYSIIEYDTTIIKSGGDSQTFVGKFFDTNNKVLSDLVGKWEINCDFEDKLDVRKVGNILTVGIDDDSLIDEEFKIIFSDINGNYSSSLTVSVRSLL